MDVPMPEELRRQLGNLTAVQVRARLNSGEFDRAPRFRAQVQAWVYECEGEHAMAALLAAKQSADAAASAAEWTKRAAYAATLTALVSAIALLFR